jgi:hypothetical protein
VLTISGSICIIYTELVFLIRGGDTMSENANNVSAKKTREGTTTLCMGKSFTILTRNYGQS